METVELGISIGWMLKEIQSLEFETDLSVLDGKNSRAQCRGSVVLVASVEPNQNPLQSEPNRYSYSYSSRAKQCIETSEDSAAGMTLSHWSHLGSQ